MSMFVFINFVVVVVFFVAYSKCAQNYGFVARNTDHRGLCSKRCKDIGLFNQQPHDTLFKQLVVLCDL